MGLHQRIEALYSISSDDICLCEEWMYIRSHNPEKASALDFKSAVALRFGHSDVVFNLFIETQFYAN